MKPLPRIALIDDNRSWLETLSQYLREKGLSPVTADDGLKGLALLESAEVPLAIIDLYMPGMDGLELLRQLRRRRREIVVLMVSSEDDPSAARQALAEGARAFLPKNVSPRSLLRAIHLALEPARPATRQPEAIPLWQRLLPAPRKQEPSTARSQPAHARSSRARRSAG
jgi:DNA-binding response OmpR family regulator